MSLFDRLSERLVELLDDVALPTDLARQLDTAEHALAAGDAGVALRLALDVEARRPQTWRARVIAGLAHEALGQLDAATARLGNALELRDDATVRIALGRIATRVGALRTAREHFDHALARRTDDETRLGLLLAIADLDERTGPRSRAATALRQAVRLAPGDATLRVRLARAQADDDAVDAALDTLTPLVPRPDAPLDALLLAGQLCQRRRGPGDRASARDVFARILAQSPDNADALEGLARERIDDGDSAGAAPLLRRALLTAPVSSQARLQRTLGDCLVVANDDEGAADAYRASTAFDATADVLAALAAAAMRAGRPAEARDASSRALAAAPHHAEATVALARARIATGDLAAARNTLALFPAVEPRADVLTAWALCTTDPVEQLALVREALVLAPGDEALDELLRKTLTSLAPRLPALGAAGPRDAAAYAPFLERLAEAVARHPLLQDLVPSVTALRQRLDEPLNVAVVGEFNAGKSTLLNAFVGERMLATGVLPTTSHVNVIRYGPRRVARWTRHDGSVVEIPYEEAARLTRREPEAIAALELLYPHPDLRAVNFWDTPGFNAPDPLHEARALEALATTDAVVWVLDANQALSGTEFARLNDIPNRGERLLVVVNKADRLNGDPDARAAIEAHLHHHLGDATLGVHWLSALRASEARAVENAAGPGRDARPDDRTAHGGRADDSAAPGDEARPDDGGWAEFEAALRTAVFDRAGRLKALEVEDGLRRLVDDVLRRATDAAAAVERARDDAAPLHRDVDARAARWSGEVSAASRAHLSRTLQDLRARVAGALRAAAEPSTGLLGRPHVADVDRAAARHQLRAGLAEAMAAECRRVLDAAAALERAVAAHVEAAATAVGPPESRVLRGRLTSYAAESRALRRVLHERLETVALAVHDARVADGSDTALERVLAADDAAGDAALQRLAPPPGPDHIASLDAWGEEYLAAVRRLLYGVDRDLDMLALDLQHRIIRPFSDVRAALDHAVASSQPTDGAQHP